MGTSVAIKLSAADLSHPERIQSLPAWLATRIESASELPQKDASGTYRMVMTLPKDQLLSADEIQAVARHVMALNQALERTPLTSGEAEAETLTYITKMMLSSNKRYSEQSAEATGEAYQEALDDLPPWSVRSAIRLWRRGRAHEFGQKPYDYTYRPEPAILRKIAFAEYCKVKGRALQLQQLLGAQERIEYSPEYCVMMLEKIAAVMQPVAKKSVDNFA